MSIDAATNMQTTPEIRARIRELAEPAKDDYDRAVLMLLDDFARCMVLLAVMSDVKRREAIAALSEQPAPDHAWPPTREEVRQAAKVILRCNGHDLSVWGGDDLHDDSAQDALKELSR